MCTEAEARAIIGPEGAETLIDVVRGAWKDYRESGRALRSTPRAGFVWDSMMNRSEAAFADFDGVVVTPKDQSQVYILQGRILLRFKKLSINLRTANFPTATQEFNTERGHFDGMPVDLSTVSCGYVLDPSESEITMVAAVREVANRVEWYIDLDELARGVTAPVAPILPNIGPDGPSLPSIRRTNRKRGDDSGE